MKRLLFLAAGMFAMGCDDYVFAGLLPAIGATLHSSTAAIVQGSTAFGIAYVVSAPLCALLLARWSARRVLIAALSFFVAGNVLTLVSGGLVAYLASRAIAGLGAGLYLPVAIAAATQLVEPSARGRALSFIWGANSAGAVVGVPVGLWLAERMGWHATIGLILALSLVAAVGVVFNPLALRAAAPPSIRQQLGLLTDRRVLAIIGVMFLTATGSLGLYASIASVLEGSAVSASSALTLWNIGGLIGSTAIGFVVDRTGKPRFVMAAVLAVLASSILVIPSASALSVFGLVPFLIWGAMGWATVTPQQYALIELRPDQDATLVALNSSAVSLGSIAGASLGGLAVAAGLSVRALPYAAATILVCALLSQLALLPRRKEALA